MRPRVSIVGVQPRVVQRNQIVSEILGNFNNLVVIGESVCHGCARMSEISGDSVMLCAAVLISSSMFVVYDAELSSAGKYPRQRDLPRRGTFAALG